MIWLNTEDLDYRIRNTWVLFKGKVVHALRVNPRNSGTFRLDYRYPTSEHVHTDRGCLADLKSIPEGYYQHGRYAIYLAQAGVRHYRAGLCQANFTPVGDSGFMPLTDLFMKNVQHTLSQGYSKGGTPSPTRAGLLRSVAISRDEAIDCQGRRYVRGIEI